MVSVAMVEVGCRMQVFGVVRSGSGGMLNLGCLRKWSVGEHVCSFYVC